MSALLKQSLYRVYYEDTDAGGIVYYANYLKYAERGRTEFLRDLGFDHISLAEDQNLFFVVRHIEADYYKSARLDDMISVYTSVTAVQNASFSMKQDIMLGDITLVSLSVKLACINKDNRPQRLPQEIKAALAEHLTA